ncbi:MAG: hypothetical protein ACI9WU_004086 [Myxococcota bacterium]|jgi:hypothetical protein
MMVRALILLLITGCAGVAPIAIDDPRLSFESRRTLAGAQDAVAVTRADLETAQTEVIRAKDWRSKFSTSLAWGPDGAAAATARAELADAMVQVAALQLATMQKRLVLENAKRDLVVARLAIRHEVAIYNLESLRERVDATRAESGQAQTKLAGYNDTLRQKEAAWWTAYTAYLKAGGDKRVLWTRP